MKNFIKKFYYSLLLLFVVFLLFTSNSLSLYAVTPTVDSTYSTYSTNVPVNASFGTAIRRRYGVAKYVSKEISNNIFWTWDERKQDYPDILYVVYEFPIQVNMIIEKHMSSFRYVTPGSSYSYTISHSAGTVLNYSISASTELSTKLGGSTELEVDGLDFGSAKQTAYAEVETKISSTVSTSKTFTYNSTIIEEYILSKDISGYYRLETRGNFKVFVTQVYRANYKQVNKEHHGLPWVAGYDTWEWERTNYTLLEQNVLYSYVDDTSVTGFYKYSYVSGKYVYSDIKESGLKYY